MNILRLALLLAAITVSPPASSERLQSFSLLNIYIGQPLDEVKRLHPSIVCEASCLLENQKLFGHPGRLWLAYSNGKVTQLAFKFYHDLKPAEANIVQKHYDARHGHHKVFLGVEGCWEYDVSGGFLDICFNDEMSHIHWAKESRLDINLQRRDPTRYRIQNLKQ